MASDVRKIVEFALKLTGANPDAVKPLVLALTGLQIKIKTTETAFSKLQTTIATLAVPANWAKFVSSAQKLSTGDFSNLAPLTAAITKLGKVTSLPDFTPLLALNKLKTPASLSEFSDALTRLGRVTRFPDFTPLLALNTLRVPRSLNSFVDSVNTLGRLRFTRLEHLVTQLTALSSIARFPAIGTFVNNLTNLASVPSTNITHLKNALTALARLDMTLVIRNLQLLYAELHRLNTQGTLNHFAQAATNIHTLAIALQQAQSAISQISASYAAMGQAAAQASQAMNQHAKSTKDLWHKIATVLTFRLISEGIIQVQGAMRGGIDAIIDYDQALKDLQAITGSTETQVEQMGLKILDVANRTKFSAAEVAQGMRVLGQAGLNSAEAVLAMQHVSDLATGTLSNMAETVDLVTTALRVFRIDASNSQRVVDIFANAVNKSKLTVEKLRTSLNYVGPIAVDAGLSIEETSAAMMTLANAGIRASTIGTSLRQVLSQLVDPSDKFIEAARKVGVSLVDLDPTTQSFSHVLKNLGIVLRDTGTAFDVFGKRGASAALVLTKGGSQFEEMLGVLSATGTAAQMAEKQMEGLGISFKNLRDRLGTLAISIGEGGVAAGLRVFVDVTRVLIGVLNDFAQTTVGSVMVALVSFTAMIGLVVAAVTVLYDIMKATTIGIWAASIVNATKAFIALNGVMAALAVTAAVLGKAFLAITVIAAVITGIRLLFKDFHKEASQDAAILAASYSDMYKVIENYRLAVVNLKRDSEEFKNANLGLRDSLEEVSFESSAVGEAARELRASIDPLDGTFANAEASLKKYQDALSQVTVSTLKTSLDELQESIDQSQGRSGRFFSHMTEGWDRLKKAFAVGKDITFKLGDWDGMTKSWDTFINKQASRKKAFDEALDLSKTLEKNKTSFKDAEEAILSYNKTNLTANQKEQIELIELTTERMTGLIKAWIDMGAVTLTDPVEHVASLGIQLGITGFQLEALEAIWERIRQKSSDIPIFAQMATEVDMFSSGLDDLKDMYRSLGLVVSEELQKELHARDAAKTQILKDYAALMEEQKRLERDVTGTSLAAWSVFYDKLSALENAAYNERGKVADSFEANLISSLAGLEHGLREKLNNIAVLYRNNDQALAQHTAKAMSEHAKSRQILLEGVAAILVTEAEKIESSFETTFTKLNEQFSEFGESAERAWEKVSDSDLFSNKEQSTALDTWLTGLGDQLESLTTALFTDLGAVGEMFQSALKVPNIDTSNLDDIKEVFLNIASEGKDAFKDVGSAIKDVLDIVQDKQKTIAAELKEHAQNILDIQQKAQELLFGISQESMSELEKYNSTKQYADNLFLQAAVQRNQAEILSGVARIEGLTKAQELLDRGLEASLKLTASTKQESEALDKAATERGKAVVKEQELSELLAQRSVTQSDRMKLEREITEHRNKAAGFDREALKFTKEMVDLETSQADRSSAVLKHEAASVSIQKSLAEAKERELDAWDKQEKKALDLLELLDKIKLATENTIALTLDTTVVKTDLELVKTELGLLSQQEIILPAPDTTAVTDSFAGMSQGYQDNIETMKVATQSFVDDTSAKFASISELNPTVTFDIQATGSATKPISEKIADIKNMFMELSGLTITITLVMEGLDKALKQAQSLVSELNKIKNKKVTITTEYKTTGKPPSKKRWGGRIPGYGGGDRHPVLAESGEWFIRKEAVKKYGDSFMASLNNLHLPKFQLGGKVGANPGSVPASSPGIFESLANFGTVNLMMNDVTIPAMVHTNVIQELDVYLTKMKRFRT